MYFVLTYHHLTTSLKITNTTGFSKFSVISASIIIIFYVSLSFYVILDILTNHLLHVC